MFGRKNSRLLLLVPLAAALAACENPAAFNDLPPTIGQFLSQVSSASGASGSFNGGSRPTPGTGPVVGGTLAGAAIPGGTVQLKLTSAATFQRVIVFLTNGVGGFVEVALPAPTSEADILLTFNQEIPSGTFSVGYMAAGAVGQWGSIGFTSAISIVSVGTGEVQVSVGWDTPTDVDLHVFEPGGEEVYFANTQSATGGTLDLDSNPACAIDGVNQENITWETAPSGEYIVVLDYFAVCGVTDDTNWVVTVFVRGQPTQVFTGSFAPTDDEVEVHRFTF